MARQTKAMDEREKELRNLELNGFKFVGYHKKVYPNGNVRNMLKVVHKCGYERIVQRNRFLNGSIKCDCGSITTRSSDGFEERYEEMVNEQIDKIEALRERKRQRELAKLKSNVTKAKSQKMIISL